MAAVPALISQVLTPQVLVATNYRKVYVESPEPLLKVGLGIPFATIIQLKCFSQHG